MPRPGSTARQNKGSNIFSSLWEGRKAKKQKAAEESARAILQNAASHEEAFISALEGIQFHRSQLKEEDLDFKSDENQPCGDLEYTALWLAQQLKANTRPVTINIDPVDQLLSHLVDRFKQAVELGRREEAFAACKALSSCFMDVRFNIPYVLPNCNEEEYVHSLLQTCMDHVSTWIHMLDLSKKIDDYTNQRDSLRPMYEEKRKFVSDFEAELESAVNNPESEMGRAFDELNDPSISIQDLSEAAKNLRLKLIEVGVQKVVGDLTFIYLDKIEGLLVQTNSQRDTLELLVSSISFPDNPNAMENYKEDLKRLDEDVNRMDKELEESMSTFSMLEGQVKAYNNLPGSVAERQEAIRQGNMIIERIKKRQADRVAVSSGSDFLRQRGIMTEEQIQAKLKEKNEQRTRAMIKDVDAIKEKTKQKY